jgi:hypothetical protein
MIEDTIGSENNAETCVVCGKGVQGGAGFSRVNHGGNMVNLCCPLCLETFEKDPTPYMKRFAKIAEYRELRKLTPHSE